MPFFIKGKRKSSLNGPSKNPVKKKKKPTKNEDISSDSEEEVRVQQEYTYSSDEEQKETAQEKKLRLATKYLEEIRKEELRRSDAEGIDHETISNRIKDDLLAQAGRLRKSIAKSVLNHGEIIRLKCKEHSRSITCLIVSPDNNFIYSASEDFNIVKWSLPEKKKVSVIKRSDVNGHKKRILALALSTDQKYLASGDSAARIAIWNPVDMTFIRTFSGHRRDVTGLAFRKDTHQLFSCSSDKTVKVWNLDEMMYVETLYGHQCGISAVDALARDRAVTAGGRDNSLRIWKIVEESHLVLNGCKETVDCVQLLDEEHMITGGEDGYVCLWSAQRKRPLCSLADAHGPGAWIISVATCLYTDLFASGSHSGSIQIYNLDEGMKKFTRLLEVQVEGNVNALAFTSDGGSLIAGIGREHRLGRWTTVPKAKNEILIIPIVLKANT